MSIYTCGSKDIDAKQETWAELARENAAQRKKIAELEAIIEQFKSKHAILNKRVEMAEGFAKRSATIRQVCADRADRATAHCQIYTERAERAKKLININSELAKGAEESMIEREKSADSPEQQFGKHSPELAVETVENQVKLAAVPELPADMQTDRDLPDKAAQFQNKLTDVPEKPTDKCGNAPADKTAKGQEKAAKKINFFKATVGMVAELFRAHQRKHRHSPPKPVSDSKGSKKRMSFFEHIGQSATLCTMATAHTSAGSRF
ncbi:hypothetical protein IWW49_004362 [Coemansia sp. RSA 1797]|nr:hypothetical protein IWW49_004362 [Coemansia sp. RSA 1797]